MRVLSAKSSHLSTPQAIGGGSMEQGSTPLQRVADTQVDPIAARSMILNHASDIIHASLVIFICTSATVYALVAHDHSDNIWIVYGSAIAFAAGRAGVSAARQFTRVTDR